MDILKINLFGDLWLLPNEISVDKSLMHADINFFNLETPVIDDTDIPKAKKAGPHINARVSDFIKIRPFLGNAVFCLANNHIMDYGTKGLMNTIAACEKLEVKYSGVGEDNIQASQPLIVVVENVSIAYLAMAEVQFGAAQINKAGYNRMSSSIFHQIKELKKEHNYVIVSVHGASEMSPVPSPDWQDKMRSLIDAGADLIHGHHAHVPQGFERYQEGYIFYGLGNFMVDPQFWCGHSNTLWSIVPQITLDNLVMSVEIKIAVIEQTEGKIVIRLAREDEHEKHKLYLDLCNEALGDKVLLTGLWQEVAMELFESSFSKWLNLNIKSYLRSLSKRQRLSKMKQALVGKESVDFVGHGKLLLWYHLFACESHNKVIETAIGIKCGEIQDFRNKKTKDKLALLS